MHPTHQPGAKPHPATNPHLPNRQKTSPKSPPLSESETTFRFVSGGTGGKFSGVREVWRERGFSFKRTLSPSKVFPYSPRSFPIPKVFPYSPNTTPVSKAPTGTAAVNWQIKPA